MRTNDTVTGLMLIALSGLMIYLTLDFPDFPGQKYGPSLFPRILASGLILCGAILIARGVSARRAGLPWIAFADWTRDPWRLASFLMLPALVVLYILVSEQVGFIPVAFAMLLFMFLWFRARLVVALPVAAAATWIVHWFFATMMRVPLPRGLLTDIL
ncbi:MAG: tripartite tricarboxylate transporter TctB family protein [Hyphomicrobiaceae bacterium]|nr:tripartite tricarboxylate transporter TctB family protein [Hyphomicrobiaceae bacterium]